MQLCAFLLLSLALAFRLASPMPHPDINGTQEWKDIPDINKGLNLREGDIIGPNQRSTFLGNECRWDIPVPYELSVNLSMNYKGVILRAFEQFRLKSCIDFKPRATEDFYISVESLEGCWSYIGRSSPGGQTLSIGNGCGIKAIVEHEFLHALGFLHEQSRYDRDNYVTINFKNIIKGQVTNFNKYSKNVTTSPYDYYSVMHYDKNAFSNGNGSTIITKLPKFQDVIGQRLDMSENDAIELNKLYKCNSSISFHDHCSFDDESLCQMSVYSAAGYGWQRVKSVSGINVTDHTYLSKEQNGMSFFMHFSTKGRKKGNTARMESKTMTPKRDCKVQCLQFYYYHSGTESDQLNIWIREYQNEADNRGTLRLMDQITDGRYYWDNPRSNGTRVTIGSETVYVGSFLDYPNVIPKDDLTRRQFIKGGDIIFLFSMQDISGLLQKDSLPCSKVTVKNFKNVPHASAQQGPYATSEFRSSSAKTVSSMILMVVCLLLLVN